MNQEEKRYSQIKKIINANEGLCLHDKKGGKFHFPLYMSEDLKNTGIDALDLSVRSVNSLKRAGYTTVGELTTALHEGVNLKKVRNCGDKSVEEIMQRLFMLQYESLDPDEQDEYLIAIVKMNANNKIKRY